MKIFESLVALTLSVSGKNKISNSVQQHDAPRTVCGGRITGDSIITSPGFDDPGHYSNDLNCTWDIEIVGVSGFTIFPVFLELENESTCSYDSLNISFSGRFGDAELIFCASDDVPETFSKSNRIKQTKNRNRRPSVAGNGALESGRNNLGFGGGGKYYIDYYKDVFLIDSNKATINFKTDSSIVMRGFKLRIQKGNNIGETGCDQVQSGSGSLSSPDFPKDYGNNELCRFTLNALQGKVIKISFHHFDVEATYSCQYDYLSINGRKHCGLKEKGFYNRFAPPQTMFVFAESTELVWKTDFYVKKGGFSLSWESVDHPIQFAASGPMESAAGFHDHMEVFFSQLIYQMKEGRPWSFRFLSRSWNSIRIPEEYFQNNGKCKWKFHTPKYQPFDFKDFDENLSICMNLINFANNAKGFMDNFVCMDGHDQPRRVFNRWQKRIKKIKTMGEGYIPLRC